MVLAVSLAAAQKNATIEHVQVRGNGDAIEVEIQTSGAEVAPNTQSLTAPDRIVIDFPGASPSAGLRAQAVNRGALKSVRTGLFSNNPPITRIVLDLAGAQSYQISTAQNAVVVKLGAGNAAQSRGPSPRPGTVQLRETALVTGATAATPAKLVKTNLSANPSAGSELVAKKASANQIFASPAAGSDPGTSAEADPTPVEPPKPVVNVSFENGMLSIRAEKATLSQVLFEVQQKTQAEVAIPAGAEREEIVVNLGPGPARDVLSALLNGSPYNFIFVGNELTLQRVILTRRDPNVF